MNWKESKSAKVPYASIAEKIWGECEILWEDCEEDYQGHAHFIAHYESNNGYLEKYYCIAGWDYGTCTGCCEWADKPEHEILQAFLGNARWYDSKEKLLAALSDESALRDSILWSDCLDIQTLPKIIDVVNAHNQEGANNETQSKG